ncbi:DUF835 domain-containing protein [Thermococcus gorgonarius]|uniref:DUF835 domain-containing protein n=1 Tax=Thermococcus gorgonarius TaxID=71997 RepID=A0A2Z2MBV1_THEGO|nr:DUF835 domain-containing protein [Thermococcus gorgonarius]ASJ01414.1 hypothetical protein A3K92_07930 [Thermococcus gorgonarius]
MSLRVPLWKVVYDVILLLAITYIWWFFFKRRRIYVSGLRFFVNRASLFLFFGVLGNMLDLIADFYPVPYDYYLIEAFYGVSIIGSIYTMIAYVLTLERSYIPVVIPSDLEGRKDSLKSNPLAGSYIILGSRGKVFDLLEILKDLSEPTLVFTRNPDLYSDLGDFVVPVWVTQIYGKGIPPTALHVMQDEAIRFISEKNGSIVVIDCLEYLLIYNDFPAVFKFLINLKDIIVSSRKALIVFVDENALDEKQKALLLREFEPL